MDGFLIFPGLQKTSNSDRSREVRTVRGRENMAEEMRIEAPWGAIVLKCWNSRESSPVLVAHGLCENAGAFDRLIPLLSKNFYYVVIDLPGHGRSSAFPKGLPLDFMNYVSQLQRIVSHFRWKRFSLMGHSFGAHLLEFFAATFTRKVERLVLLDAISPTPVASEIFLLFHCNQTKEVIRLEKADRCPNVHTYEEALARVVERRMSKLEPDAAKPLLERCLEKTGNGYVFTTDPRIRREIKPAVGEDVILDQFRRIRCPVLVVLAKNSEQFWLLNSPGFYATILKILEKTNPLSSVVRVPGNHCVHNNQPEIIAPKEINNSVARSCLNHFERPLPMRHVTLNRLVATVSSACGRICRGLDCEADSNGSFLLLPFDLGESIQNRNRLFVQVTAWSSSLSSIMQPV